MGLEDGVYFEVRVKNGFFLNLQNALGDFRHTCLFGAPPKPLFTGSRCIWGLHLPQVGVTMHYPPNYPNDGEYEVVNIKERRGKNPIVYVKPAQLKERNSEDYSTI